jgi:spoIIIJ-associated protein
MREQQIARGQKWLEKLLQLMGTDTQVKVGTDDNQVQPGSCWLIIDRTGLSPEQIEILIGFRGESIDAIQYLANTILNLEAESQDQQAYTIELNDYRLKRQAELLALAKRVANEVRTTGQEIEVKSLSSAERRQIHTFLQDAEDLATESRGLEPDRRLVVRLR